MPLVAEVAKNGSRVQSHLKHARQVITPHGTHFLALKWPHAGDGDIMENGHMLVITFRL